MAIPSSGATVDWRLTEPGRQLDANVVRLAAEHRIAAHAEPDLDVLILVIAGSGRVHADDGEHVLEPGALVWLPHGSRRAVHAGRDGLSYLTLHRRRPGMRISPA